MEADALAVEQHQAVPDLEPAHTHLLPDGLRQRAGGVEDLDGQIVQKGLLRAPEPGGVHRQDRLPLRRKGNTGGRDLPLPIGEAQGRMALAQGLQRHPDLAGGKVIAQGCGDFHVPHVDRRYGVQEHLPEDAGEAEEVLVLHPAGVGVLEDLGGQLVLPGDQIVRQLELRGGEAVLAVARVVAVAPHGQTALRPLEGDEDAHPRHPLRQGEILYIACNRVKFLRRLPQLDVLAAIPGVLDVGVLGASVAVELGMGGDGELVPAPAVHTGGEEVGNGPGEVLRIVEIPVPVEGEAGGGAVRQGIKMVGVGRFPAVLEELRGFGQFILKLFHTASKTISFPVKSPVMQGMTIPPYIHPAPERTSPVSLER